MSKPYLFLKNEQLKLMNRIDMELLSFLDGFQYEEWNAPSLIEKSILEKIKYDVKFPHYLSYLFTKDNESQFINSNYCLSPAACLHVYPQFEGKDIAENKIITLLEKVYRNEDEYNGSTRLWEFTVREIVFIGDEEYVKDKLFFIADKAQKFLSKHVADFRFETATDHFYPSQKNEILKNFQERSGNKQELVVDLDGKSVALSSINFHGESFSKPFSFSKNRIVTGCVGFGLERWLTMFEQKGLSI